MEQRTNGMGNTLGMVASLPLTAGKLALSFTQKVLKAPAKIPIIGWPLKQLGKLTKTLAKGTGWGFRHIWNVGKKIPVFGVAFKALEAFGKRMNAYSNLTISAIKSFPTRLEQGTNDINKAAKAMDAMSQGQSKENTQEKEMFSQVSKTADLAGRAGKALSGENISRMDLGDILSKAAQTKDAAASLAVAGAKMPSIAPQELAQGRGA